MEPSRRSNGTCAPCCASSRGRLHAASKPCAAQRPDYWCQRAREPLRLRCPVQQRHRHPAGDPLHRPPWHQSRQLCPAIPVRAPLSQRPKQGGNRALRVSPSEALQEGVRQPGVHFPDLAECCSQVAGVVGQNAVATAPGTVDGKAPSRARGLDASIVCHDGSTKGSDRCFGAERGAVSRSFACLGGTRSMRFATLTASTALP
jgi:hypothetical protein